MGAAMIFDSPKGPDGYDQRGPEFTGAPWPQPRCRRLLLGMVPLDVTSRG
jgi:hypothetical protein